MWNIESLNFETFFKIYRTPPDTSDTLQNKISETAYNLEQILGFKIKKSKQADIPTTVIFQTEKNFSSSRPEPLQTRDPMKHTELPDPAFDITQGKYNPCYDFQHLRINKNQSHVTCRN